jgi:basic membrane lipoprotein Med (substrate-binding protein (PBP1-ABC) superfamily)
VFGTVDPVLPANVHTIFSRLYEGRMLGGQVAGAMAASLGENRVGFPPMQSIHRLLLMHHSML